MTFPHSYDLDQNHHGYKNAWFNQPEPPEDYYAFTFGDDVASFNKEIRCTESEAKKEAQKLFMRHGFCTVHDSNDNLIESL